MNLHCTSVNGFHLITIRDTIEARMNLEELRRAVEALVAEGHINVALSFTPSSHLDSRAIGDLARCVESVNAHGGRLAIVQPNREIADFLRIVGFVKHVEIYSTVAEIGFSH